MTVAGKGWPIHVRRAGVDARGRFEGTIEAKREGGAAGRSRATRRLLGVEATGPALAGDRLAIDRMAAACDVGQTAAGWTIREARGDQPGRLDHGDAGRSPPTAGAKLQGRVDLAALAKLLPRAMRLRDGLTLDKGTATLRADLTSVGGSDRVELAASLDDFAATEGGRPLTLREPARLSASGSRAADKVAVETLEVKAAGWT